MKKFFSCLCATLMMAGYIAAAPIDCDCPDCTCTQEKHCGCFSTAGCRCAPGTKCGENFQSSSQVSACCEGCQRGECCNCEITPQSK